MVLMRFLDSRHALRCVLFHNVSDVESSFTRGLGVTISLKHFQAALEFLVKHYRPVSLGDILEDVEGQRLPDRPVLVTFDDAYASVFDSAAPLCQKLGVPAVLFVNAAFLDNQELSLDNLLCHVVNVIGFDPVNVAVREVKGADYPQLGHLAEVFSCFLPAISRRQRKVFAGALLKAAGLHMQDLSCDADLYLSSRQVQDLVPFGFEIGNHTYSHVNCRSLSQEDRDEEIGGNKLALETILGTKVRSFSVPYGSSADLTSELALYLRNSGHQAIFLAESLSNPLGVDRFRLNRTSITDGSDSAFFSEIEIYPRLRVMRNRFVKVMPSVEVHG
jgi:peptidoglycan/xylan/chitin deacetylase (PgdA/CDA1 family)